MRSPAAKLGRIFPYAYYHLCLEKYSERGVGEDFQEIETAALLYLQRTKELYQIRIAYSIGIFREILERACLPVSGRQPFHAGIYFRIQ
jgi:hypothetical protein